MATISGTSVGSAGLMEKATCGMSRGYPGQNRAMSQPVHEHKRAFGASHSVTPLELFFDLVFVFAITQVT